MDTEIFKKKVRNNKKSILVGSGTGLSTAALIFLFQHFTTQTDFKEHRNDCRQKQAEIWQRIMDHELEIDRLKR